MIVYDSMLGKTRSFAERLGKELQLPVSSVSDYTDSEPFVLITYTINFGQVPATTNDFLREHHSKLLGVISGGNKVWGDNFGKAADTISQSYGVPLVHKFELKGNASDIKTIRERLGELNETFRIER